MMFPPSLVSPTSANSYRFSSGINNELITTNLMNLMSPHCQSCPCYLTKYSYTPLPLQHSMHQVTCLESVGMHSERICAVDTWCQGVSQYDCMFINTDPLQPGMCGLDVFSFFLSFLSLIYCAMGPCPTLHITCSFQNHSLP